MGGGTIGFPALHFPALYFPTFGGVGASGVAFWLTLCREVAPWAVLKAKGTPPPDPVAWDQPAAFSPSSLPHRPPFGEMGGRWGEGGGSTLFPPVGSTAGAGGGHAGGGPVRAGLLQHQATDRGLRGVRWGGEKRKPPPQNC